MADVTLKPADRESLERYERIVERLVRELDELLSAHEELQKRRKKIVTSGKKPTWYLDRRDAWNAEALTWRRKKIATLRSVAEQHVTAFKSMLKIWSGPHNTKSLIQKCAGLMHRTTARLTSSNGANSITSIRRMHNKETCFKRPGSRVISILELSS